MIWSLAVAAILGAAFGFCLRRWWFWMPASLMGGFVGSFGLQYLLHVAGIIPEGIAVHTAVRATVPAVVLCAMSAYWFARRALLRGNP